MPREPRYLVRIEAHHIPPRFDVPASERFVHAPDARLARKRGVSRAHVELGLPALRSVHKASWPHVTATLAPEDTLL